MSDSEMRSDSISSDDIVVNERNAGTVERNASNDWAICEFDKLCEYEFNKIMSFFSIVEKMRLSLVCLKWQTMIDKDLKSVLVMNSCTTLSRTTQTPLSHKAFVVIIKKCSNVRHIDMRGLLRVNFDNEDHNKDHNNDNNEANPLPNVLESIAHNCQHLQSINFGAVSLVLDEEFIKFAKYFTQIKKISSQEITERALNSIIDSQNIQCIDISRNENVSKPHFKRLGPKIRELYLMESNVTDVSVIKELCEGNGKYLTKLSIDIKDGHVLSLICCHMKSLVSLNISLDSSGCDFKQFSNLKSLSSLTIEVMDSYKFESHQFRDLVLSLNKVNLKELTINLSPINNIAVVDNSLEEIRQNCESIEKLVIRRANSLTNAGVYAIAQLKCLKHLDFMNCLNIGDGIDFVISSCPLLRFVNLHNCNHIHMTTVDTIIEKAKLSPNENFTLDVVDTHVGQDLEIQIPSNLQLFYKYEDCKYDCDHGYDADGYNSGPDLDFGPGIDEFYDGDDYDYYDDYEDEDLDDYEFS